MPAKGIVVCVCAVALVCAACGHGAATDIFFDLDGDLAADTEYTVFVGEQVVVPVYLRGFGETTGSFQFDVFYDGEVLALIDYDTYVGQPDEDPGLSGPIQTLAELGPWATLQWSEPVTQELNQLGGGGGGARLEFYTAGSLTQTAGGDGILAYLVFDAVALGRTTLQLQAPGGTWFLEDVDDQPDHHRHPRAGADRADARRCGSRNDQEEEALARGSAVSRTSGSGKGSPPPDQSLTVCAWVACGHAVQGTILPADDWAGEPVDAITVCYILIQLEAGGAERQLVALLEGLDRTRFRPIVVVERPGGAFEQAVRGLGIPIHVLARRMRWDPFIPWRLARLLRRERVDVVQTISPMWDFYGVLAGMLARVPVRLMTWRNIRYSLFHMALVWLVTPLASRLIANSEHAARRLRRWYVPRSRVMAIPNGIDCARFDAAPNLHEKRRELGLGNDGPLIGMVARLWAQKDHRTLIEAAARLIARYPRLVVLLVGDGPLRAELEALAGQVLPPGRCRILGRRRDAPDLYHLFDVTVLSTRYEGMPNVVMEAMAARRPVVATAVDGCTELIEDGVTGLLVPRRDPLALAVAIARMLDDKALAARLGQAGREHMREHYSLERLAERHEALYTALLERRRKARAR